MPTNQTFGNVSSKICASCAHQIIYLYPKSLLLSQLGLWNSTIKVTDIIRWHGVKSLIKDSTYIISDRKGVFSVFDRLVHNDTYEFYELLQDIGQNLLHYPYPWVKIKDVPEHDFSLETQLRKPLWIHLDILEANALFGTICLFFIIAEASDLFTALISPNDA